jgi:hypothetical protein
MPFLVILHRVIKFGPALNGPGRSASFSLPKVAFGLLKSGEIRWNVF